MRIIPSHAPAAWAGAATTDGELSGTGGIAFDPMVGVRVAEVGSIEPARGGFHGHSHARAWPGCNVARDHGSAMFTFGQIVDGDLLPLVR
jgi:hypothetical protein